MAKQLTQVEALRLFRAAQGNREALAKIGESKARVQLDFAESVASGEILSQILPAIRKDVRTVYENIPQQHQAFTTRKLVQAIDVEEDINVVKFDDQTNIPGINAGDTFIPGGLPRLLPREKYPQIGYSASGKKIKASKIGEAGGIDWEAIVRSRGASINIVNEFVKAFGRHAGNQEEIDVAKLLVGSTGFNTTTLADSLAVSGNPDLSSPQTLPAAIAALQERPVEGILPAYDKYILLTTPSYAAQARQILQARRVTKFPARTGAGSTAVSDGWEETIELGAEIEVIGWRWLSRIWGTMGKGWLLIPVVNGDDDLPVLTSNYLEGYETPSFWVKDSNARQFGGGEVNPLADGDFDSDAVETKVRHVHGATGLWTAGIAYSAGTNA